MAVYDSSYTGVQIDTAVGAVITAQAAGGIVNANGINTILGDYLTISDASSTYLTQSDASSTYLTQTDAASTYLPLTGGTLTGALTLANNTLNNIGDDVAIGDVNQAGALAIKGLNGDTNLRFIQYNATAAGTLSWNGSQFTFSTLLNITSYDNTVTIGSQNTGWCHFINSANRPFYFNKTTSIDGDLGTPDYPVKNIYIGKANGAGIYYQGTKANYRMIRFIDNTSDNYGNSISIGGGGTTIIGGGESADAAAGAISTNGAELMYVCNDGDVTIFSNMQNGWASRKTFNFNTAGNLSVPGTVSSGSSYLIKENIKDFSVVEAQKLLKVRTVSFDFKENWGEKNQYGVIAEEVEKIIPNVVLSYGSNNIDINADDFHPKEVSYIKFIPYLIKMIQIQQEEIDQLHEKIYRNSNI